MRLNAIVAMGENRVIGYNNQLPWHLPADMKRFRTLTSGKPVLMGRKTWESIGRPLPDRCNIVITRDPEFTASGCVVATTIERAVEAASYSEEVFVIGGAKLFARMLSETRRIYMTLVHHTFSGDTFFPELNMEEWIEIEKADYPADDKNQFAFSFITYDRK